MKLNYSLCSFHCSWDKPINITRRSWNFQFWVSKKMEKPADSKQMLFDGQDGYDAVVVGSGYGGSVAACRLSMAGVKVCLVEKGRKWEAKDFPTDSFKIMSAVRMESQNLGLSFGPKDALFQVSLPFHTIWGYFNRKTVSVLRGRQSFFIGMTWVWNLIKVIFCFNYSVNKIVIIY